MNDEQASELRSSFILHHSSFASTMPPPMSETSAPVLTVIVPCFNERATVAELLRRVKAVPIDKEIIVIDDQSTDGSREVVATLAREWPELYQIVQPVNRGKGAAIRRGIEEARGEIVV